MSVMCVDNPDHNSITWRGRALKAEYHLKTVEINLEIANKDIQKYKIRIGRLIAVLEELSRLGAGDHYGNSDGNIIAQRALERDKIE